MQNPEKTLLLVDDEPNNLRALKRALAEENYSIVTAASGQEALELMQNNYVQVIISDQRMPNMLGTELLKEVRKLYPNTIRMILSAYSDFDVIKDAINEGAIFKFINKPWDNEQISRYIREAFSMYAQQQEKDDQLINLIYQDKLTNLNNRFRFLQEIPRAILRANANHYKLMLMIIDIDHFSEINNSLGREAGDQILKHMAETLGNHIKDSDYLARWGSDQFSILVENPTETYQSILHKLHKQLTSPLRIENKTVHFTISIGASIYPDDSTDSETLMRQASVALRHSTQAGVDSFRAFEKSMEQTEDHITLLAELHDALANDEFVVYYQPIIALATGRITSVEALLRWQHPKKGLLAPGKFINLCEETGLIVPIGEKVLHSACTQLKKWHDEGFSNLSVAVNFSARQFYNAGLFDLITKTIQQTEIPPKFLDVEITESLLMKNIQENIALMQTLAQSGVKFSLDDFGTGYSSLSYLKLFPFNFIKIDQSFIRDITVKKENISIVTAIISLANSLGLNTIAEGVETSEQLDLLKKLNCDLIQGYFFSEPVAAAQLTHLLAENKAKIV